MSQKPREFYISRNNNKFDSIEAGNIVIALLLPWNDQENTYKYLSFINTSDLQVILKLKFSKYIEIICFHLRSVETATRGVL